MRYYFRAYIILLFILFKTHLVSQERSRLYQEIQKILKYDVQVDTALTPGFVVGVIDGESTFIEVFGHGISNDLLDEKSVFELGNVSKPLSFLIYEQLIKSGKIDVGTKINDLLTEAERNDKLERMSIGSLLELPSHFPNRINLKNFQSLDQPFLNINKGDLIGYYSNFRPAFSSVNKTYGDTDYAIWQVLVEKALGQDFQMIIDTYLNQLLGSEIFFTQFEFKNEGIAKGLTRGGQVGSPYMLDGYGAGNGLKACLTDLLAFLRFRIDSTPDLTKVEKNLVSAWSKDVKGYKGMYLVKPKKKVFVISTNGTSNIHSSFLAYVPATKTGIVILSNGASGTKDLGMLILRMINNNWKRNKS